MISLKKVQWGFERGKPTREVYKYLALQNLTWGPQMPKKPHLAVSPLNELSQADQFSANSSTVG